MTPISDLHFDGWLNDTLMLTFSAATGATSVTIMQSDDDGVTWSAASVGMTENAPSDELDASETWGIVDTLTQGATYKFKLVVVGGSKAGDSNTITVSVPIQQN